MHFRPMRSRIAAFCLCTVMLLTLALGDALASGQSEPKAAAETVSPIIRVLLRRVDVTNRMDIILASPYGVVANGSEMYFAKGTVLSFRLENGELFLYYENMSAELGRECYLKRYRAEENSETGFRFTNMAPLYMGDLHVKVSEEKIQPVLHIHVEDYLMGVVPYEMSDYFPVEALKAQTVAARTYALRKRNPDRDYDVVDTTNDQVFKGYLPGFANSRTAIEETAGVCGFYNNNLAQCYYAASNGGKTEKVESVWNVKGDYGYYVSVEDPYDLENPSSTVKRLTLQKQYTNAGKDEAPYAFRCLLSACLGGELRSLGLDPAPESIQVVKIHHLSLVNQQGREDGPKDAIRLEVSLNGRTRTDAPGETAVVITMLDEDAMYYNGLITPILTPEPTPQPTPEPIYGPFETVEKVFELVVPIFPLAEENLQLDLLPNYQNEIWSLKDERTSYTLEVRRYGHGVGMSQRGAEWMASRYGKSYRDILAFYYPGMELVKYQYQETELPQADPILSATMGPALSPTPLPTLMPLTATPMGGQYIAVVSNIDDDSSLNLRALPSLSGNILMRLYKNQRLLVLEHCPEEGWVRVRTDYAEGYVMESFLKKEK